MFPQLQPHMGQICLVLVALISVSESMPFFEKIKANGIFHALWLQMKGKAVEGAKPELDKK